MITEGETYKYNDKVTLIGHENWPAQMGNIASAMFGGNVTKLIVSMDYDGEYQVNEEDTGKYTPQSTVACEIFSDRLVLHSRPLDARLQRRHAP